MRKLFLSLIVALLLGTSVTASADAQWRGRRGYFYRNYGYPAYGYGGYYAPRYGAYYYAPGYFYGPSYYRGYGYYRW